MGEYRFTDALTGDVVTFDDAGGDAHLVPSRGRFA